MHAVSENAAPSDRDAGRSEYLAGSSPGPTTAAWPGAAYKNTYETQFHPQVAYATSVPHAGDLVGQVPAYPTVYDTWSPHVP